MNLGYGIRSDGFTLCIISKICLAFLISNKPYQVKTFHKGKEIKRLYTLSVRYLDYQIDYDYKYAKQELLKNKTIKITKLGSGLALLCEASKVFEDVFKLLTQNRYVFRKKNLSLLLVN